MLKYFFLPVSNFISFDLHSSKKVFISLSMKFISSTLHVFTFSFAISKASLSISTAVTVSASNNFAAIAILNC